jgi:hypothetical protein
MRHSVNLEKQAQRRTLRTAVLFLADGVHVSQDTDGR